MKHTVIYFLIRFISGGIGLFSIYILTRILTIEEYGNFSLLIAILTFTSSISYQWLVIATSRLIIENKQNITPFIKAVIILFILSSIFVSFIIFISTYIYPKITESYYLPLLFIAIILGIYNLLIHLANIVQRPFIYGGLTTIRAIFSLLTTVTLIQYFETNVISAVIGFSFGFLMSILLFIVYFNKQLMNLYSNKKNENSKQFILTLFRYGVPLSFTYLAIMIISTSDRLMLGKMSEITQVAAYSTAYDLTQQTVGVLMSILFLAFFPKILNAYSEQLTDTVKLLMQKLSTLLLIICIFISIIFLIASAGIAKIMFGEEFISLASNIMPIIAIAVAIGGYKGYYIDIIFQLHKRTDIQLIITLFMAIVNILINIILIPKYGAIGAAISTLVAFLLGSVLSWIYSRKLLFIPQKIGDNSKVFISGLIVLIFSYFITFNLTSITGILLTLAMLSGIYFLILISLNIFNVHAHISKYFKGG